MNVKDVKEDATNVPKMFYLVLMLENSVLSVIMRLIINKGVNVQKLELIVLTGSKMEELAYNVHMVTD